MPTTPPHPHPHPDSPEPVGSAPPVYAVSGSRGVQAGNNNTQYNTVTQTPLPAIESVPAVPGLSRIPLDTALFVGRTDELDQLDAVLDGSGRAVVVAVHGLGGVGKSTLAARFAHRHAGRFGFQWWITADSPAALDTGLGDLAEAILPAAADLPVEQRTALGVRWLATHEDWLLVLDNATSPQEVAALLSRVRTGTIVVTSRQRSGWLAAGGTVSLDVLAADEALQLLARIVGSEWPEADLAGADRLCAELGWLPLAVEQAGAYLAQTRISPDAYLDLLARFPARMFTATAEGGNAQRTMARGWHVTLDRLADTAAAGRVLRQLAWFAPDGIPRDLLAGEVEEPELSEALGRLAAYSMVTLTGNTVSVHRLVQAVTRTPDPTDPHRQPADIAAARDSTATVLAATLSDLVPHTPADWPAYRMVLPHARALLEHARPDTDTTQTSRLLNDLSLYLEGQG
ncbi:AAA family ATPase [Amycolatopsis sp., V23-08]|uniref:AAA family ATPase n=1 Tax=Amycolatopsis heterodermiae TaxID=3110235 RepID=A0ABU5R8E3_9PSEU|nr:AAA family ATPase [Amycolatopsis sp., V23-08]MEA5362491.1 AAA family ATPase [Amycolatopsis sp., V23-08]